MTRLGLFGGSFDPVHNAHVALARIARDTLALDELLLVPAGRPWQKAGRTLAPAADRVAMLGLALAGEARMRIEDCELKRSGPSYTVDTVLELQSQWPEAEWFLVIGQDQYAGFHTWHRWQALLQRVMLAVAGRAGSAPQPGAPLAAVPHAVVSLPLPAMAVSASEIRTRLAQRQDISAMVPASVARYIEQNHLYGS